MSKAIYTFLLGAFGAHALAGNVLTNPGFETHTMAGWTTSSFTATNNEFHTGLWSAFNVGLFSMEQSFAPVAGSSITEVSVWSKQFNFPTFNFEFDLLYTDATSTSHFASGGSSGTWTKFDFTSSVNTSKSLSGIRLWGNTGTSTVFDDVMVNSSAVPEPASFAVLGVGSLFFLRRRKK